MHKFAKFRSDQNGNGIILCIFVLFFMLGVGGLVVDASILYKAKGEMRKAANAAALSGAQLLFNDDVSISDVVDDILDENYEKDCTLDLKIKPNKENKVTVTLDKDVSLYFMKIFGKDSYHIEVVSSAVREPATAMGGVIPLGVEEGTQLTVGTEYPLKNDNKIGPGGWFGYLDITKYAGGNTGANDLALLIANGCPNPIKVGAVISRIEGEKTSVSKNVTTRIAPIIIFKVIKDVKSESIQVTGFAYCEISVDPTDKKTLLGKFIKTADVSSISGTINDALIYKCRLVE